MRLNKTPRPLITTLRGIWGHTRLDFLLIATIGGMLWTTVAFDLRQSESEALRDAEQRTERQAQDFAQSLSRGLHEVSEVLRAIRVAHRADVDDVDPSRWSHDPAIAASPITALIMTRPSGEAFISGPSTPTTRIDVATRGFFIAQRDADADALYVGPSTTEQAGQPPMLFISRRLAGRDQAFAGVVAAAVDPARLAAVDGRLEERATMSAVIGLDGITRISRPASDDRLRRDVNSPELMSAAQAAESGFLRSVGPADGIERLVRFQRVGGYPVFVAVGVDIRDVFLPYRQMMRRDIALAGLATLVLVGLLGLIVRDRRRLDQSRRAMSLALENITQGLIMVDRKRRVPIINARAVELLSLPLVLPAHDLRFDDILRYQLDSGEFGPDGDAKPTFRRFVEAGAIEESNSVYERTRPNGAVLEVRTQMLPDGGMVRTFADITARKLAEDRIRFFAHHDGLTGLANRVVLHAKLAEAIEGTVATGRGFALIYLDLDRFKSVNDLRGHETGDKMLRLVAARLRESTRDTDVIARLGGDEFAVLQMMAEQPESAAALAQRLISRLGEPYEIDGQRSIIGASIGIALHPAHGATPDQLLRNADTALYRAKESGRRTHRLFEAAMDIRLHEHRLIERDLRDALNDRQLHLIYQPILDTATGAICGFEALLRWRHPVRGNVPPDQFIPIAEECGLMIPLCLWTLEAACTEAARWGDLPRPSANGSSLNGPFGHDRPTVSVNMSPAQFRQTGLAEIVAGVLARTGLPPAQLEIEVTEAVLSDSCDPIRTTMLALKELGVGLVLDDFGDGLSGLRSLRSFPFDKLKLDRSLIQQIEHQPAISEIVHALLLIGRSLNMSVIAEGIETEAQCALVRQLGFRYMQGFLHGRPLYGAEVRNLGRHVSRPDTLARPHGPQTHDSQQAVQFGAIARGTIPAIRA